MSVATEIERLQNAKADIKTSIEAKGVTVPSSETLDNYADYIDEIETGGGETPTKGYVINEWNSNGYPTDITTYGYTTIPEYFFFNNVTNGNFKYSTNINLNNEITSIGQYAFCNCTNLALTSLPSNLTSIGQYAFCNCTNLALTSLPSNLTSIGQSAFYNCTNLAIKSIPSGVTQIRNYNSFGYCTSLVQISMENVTYLNGASNNVGTFIQCTGLKKVWIGSAITNSGLGRYVFSGCTNLETMYIDLPRATVEAFTNYQYAFMNDTSKTGIIICNDDSDFIDKATFDALVIE